MAIGRYYQPKEYTPELYTPPVDFIAGALEKAQKQYDVNFAFAQTMRNKYINAREVDRVKANELQKSFESDIDSLVTKYNGDYSAASKDLYVLQNKMNKSFGPGGEAWALQDNKRIEDEAIKREQARVGKADGITATQMGLFRNYLGNQGATEYDPATGKYNQVQDMNLATYIDDSKIALEIADKIKPRKSKIERYAGKAANGDYLYVTEEIDIKDPTEMMTALQAGLFSNDAYVSYNTQLAKLAGVDPDAYLGAQAKYYTDNVVPALSGVMSYQQSSKTMEDWRGRKALDLSNSMRLEDKRQANRKELKAMDSELGSGDGRPSVLAIQHGVFDHLPNVPHEVNGKKLSVNQLIKDYESGKALPVSINARMLKSIKEANPTLGDTDILDLYNQTKNTAHTNGEIFYDKFNTTSAQQEEINRILPLISSGRVKISRIEPSTGKVINDLEADEKLALSAALVSAKQAKSPNYAALGKSRVSSGKVPFGTVIADPTGNGNIYVLQENRADIELLQKHYLEPAFSWIQDPLREQGDVFANHIDGKEVPTIGRRHYINGIPKNYFHVAYQGADGRWYPGLEPEDILTVNGIPIEEVEQERMLLTQQMVESTYPRKTKAAYENETPTNED